MGFLDIIRTGIDIADNLTKDLQPTFTHYAWTGQDGKGKATFASAVTRRGIIELNRKQRMKPDGTLVTIIATITVLDEVSANGAAGRREPVDPRDRIVLPDGTTGPIIDAPDSPLDAGTTAPFLNIIYLGEGGA